MRLLRPAEVVHPVADGLSRREIAECGVWWMSSKTLYVRLPGKLRAITAATLGGGLDDEDISSGQHRAPNSRARITGSAEYPAIIQGATVAAASVLTLLPGHCDDDAAASCRSWLLRRIATKFVYGRVPFSNER